MTAKNLSTGGSAQFSFRSRSEAIRRFQDEIFDLLVIGGGITGAAVARDAVSRGLSVALVERKDFAYGTSSRSSKLIHGGLRYLENLEFGLVFEALSERTLLMKTAPQRVRPLLFYMPVYQEDAHGRGLLSMGLWLYDLLAMFRAPSRHRGLSKKTILKEIPFLRAKGLKGGFKYFDASMWDDVLTVETLKNAASQGAAVANYVEAVKPIWEGDQIRGFVVRDGEKAQSNGSSSSKAEWALRARQTIVCAGPWTDELGAHLSTEWKTWLTPSKGVHLVFAFDRIPIPGALVMSHPEDGRIAFVIPRKDYGEGVVIVGTTDGPTHVDPARAEVEDADVQYLLNLLKQYFPELNLSRADILSAYVGVRPLMGDATGQSTATSSTSVLQKVSREHHIDLGPGGTVIVAGGKYTTHRKMAEEIVDFALKAQPELLKKAGPAQTESPVNPKATEAAVQACLDAAKQAKQTIPSELIDRFGGEAWTVLKLDSVSPQKSPAGFPFLEAQLRYSIRQEMTMHLEDFYLRRVPLYLARKDHGLPWTDVLARVWAEEMGREESDVQKEIERLRSELAQRSRWQS